MFNASTSSNPAVKRNLVHNVLNYDSNIMLAAIISLLVVILFILLLHVYAKWFLVQARQRSYRRSVSVPQVLGARLIHHFPSSIMVVTDFAVSPTSKGLESSVISSIPIFVFKSEEAHSLGSVQLVECAICLSSFEDEEMGRKLPRCNHAFHVECIDMWFRSHPNCPICRCPVMLEGHKTPSQFSKEIVDIQEISSETVMVSEDLTSSRRLEEIVVEVPNSDDGVDRRNDINSMRSTSSSVQSNAHFVAVGDSVKRNIRAQEYI